MVCGHLICCPSKHAQPHRGKTNNRRGFPISVSIKQKLTVKSSTKGELVGVDDMMPIILWTRRFLLAQGYGIVENLQLQDNKSSILLERNGKASSGKRMRLGQHEGYISIEWCPTKDMVANFMTKPLQGSHFKRLRDIIMGKVCSVKPNVVKVKCEGLVSNGYTRWLARQSIIGINCTTGVCWGLYSVGCSESSNGKHNSELAITGWTN